MGFMDVLGWFLAACGADFVAVLSRLLAEDAKTFIPRFSAFLIQRASSRISERVAVELREEWQGHLEDQPELVGKLWHGLSIYLWGARRICRVVGYASATPTRYDVWKRFLDILLVLLALPLILLMLAPVVLIIFLAGKGRSPFSLQLRVGKNGKAERVNDYETVAFGL